MVEDNAHGLFGKLQGPVPGHLRLPGDAELPRDQELHLRRGRRAADQRRRRFVERAEIIREKGTNRSRFFRGQVDKYTWVDIGSSYLPSDMLAAFLYAQLEARQSDPGKAAADLGATTTERWPAGRTSNDVRLPVSQRTASSPITCSTCFCRRWSTASR